MYLPLITLQYRLVSLDNQLAVKMCNDPGQLVSITNLRSKCVTTQIHRQVILFSLDFPFRASPQGFKTRLLGEGFHTLINGGLFTSPTNVGHQSIYKGVKTFPQQTRFKALRRSPKGKAQRGQQLLAVDMSRYKVSDQVQHNSTLKSKFDRFDLIHTIHSFDLIWVAFEE